MNSKKEVRMRAKRPVVVHVFMTPTPSPNLMAAAEVHGAARDRKDSIEPRHGLSSSSVLRATVGVSSNSGQARGSSELIVVENFFEVLKERVPN